MMDRDSAERAVKDANPIIDGRKANVNLAYLGAKPRNGFLQNGTSLLLLFIVCSLSQACLCLFSEAHLARRLCHLNPGDVSMARC